MAGRKTSSRILRVAARCVLLGLLLYGPLEPGSAQPYPFEDVGSSRQLLAPIVYWEVDPVPLPDRASALGQTIPDLAKTGPGFLPGFLLSEPSPSRSAAKREADRVIDALRAQGVVSLYRTDRMLHEAPTVESWRAFFTSGSPKTAVLLDLKDKMTAGPSPVCAEGGRGRSSGDTLTAQSLADSFVQDILPCSAVHRRVNTVTPQPSYSSDSKQIVWNPDERVSNWTVLQAPVAPVEPAVDQRRVDAKHAKGALRLAAWMHRPNALRAADGRSASTKLVRDIAEEINTSSVLRLFWSEDLPARPVLIRSAPGSSWPNPREDRSENADLPVTTLVLQRDQAPRREWLLVSHSTSDRQEKVLVQIPGYAEVFIDVGPSGSLHHVLERSAITRELGSSSAATEEVGVSGGGVFELEASVAALTEASNQQSGHGPVAHWKFEESGSTSGEILFDASGNRNHAVSSIWGNSPTQGKLGTARRFSGGYASIVPPPDLWNTSFSVSVWVQPNSYPSGGKLAVIYSCMTQSIRGWAVGLSDDGRAVLTIGDGAKTPWLLSSAVLPKGEWGHIAVSYDASTRNAVIYVNGQRNTNRIFNSAQPGAAQQPSLATIGRASWTDSYYLDASLDELSLYQTALNSTEVEAAYEEGTTQPPPSSPRTPSVHWTLDETADGGVGLWLDSSGNANHLTPSAWGASPVAGRVSGAWRFGGGYGQVGLSPILQSQSFSMGAWIQPTTYPATGRFAAIFSNVSSSITGWFVGLDHEGRVVLSIGTGTASPWLVSSGQLPLGEWTRIDVTFDYLTRTARIYIAAALNRTGQFANPTINNTTNPTVARASWLPSYYFEGVLDEITIHQVALTEQEIVQLAAAPPLVPERIIQTTADLRDLFQSGVEPGTTVRIARGDYIGPFASRSRTNALAGTSDRPIVITALQPTERPVIHWRNSWLGSLRYVEFHQLDFTGRINIDGDPDPSGPRHYGVSFRDIEWSLCGWGGQSECLKATKGDAMTIEFVTFYAVQAYKAGLSRLTQNDRARMSPYTLEQVDAAIAAEKDLGRSTDMPIDFVAVNNSLIRSVHVETSGTHAAIQIKGGSSGNVVENNVLSGWAVPHFRMTSRTINLAGGTCDLCFRNEGYRQFEAYNTTVRGNRIECGDACGAIATQVGTRWVNNTHWMVAGQGNCVSPSTEPASRWAMRLTNEASADHLDEVRPSHDAAFERNVWVYKKCASSAEFVNRGILCADGVNLELPGQDCVAHRSMRWVDNVVYQLDWDARIALESNPWDPNLRVRHCHATVTQVAQNWDSGNTAGLGDVSGQCVGRQGENGIDPLLVDPGLPSMRISEPAYTSLSVGANSLFPWGLAAKAGAR